jgi:putative flippase GtrA
MMNASIINNPRERGRFFRFAFVGVIGAIVDFGTFNLLNQLLGVTAVWSQVASFTAAIVSNFLWNRYWTYPDSRTKPIIQQLSQFTMISIIGLVIRTPVFALLKGPLPRMFAMIRIPPLNRLDPAFLGYNLALAIAVIVVMFWNFFVNRYWTYNDVQ